MVNAERVATAIQGIKAHALDNPALMYDALPVAERLVVLSQVQIAVTEVGAGRIASPADLHAFNCARLKEAGWKPGAIYRPLKSQTPLLRPFATLPPKTCEFVSRCFDVLKLAADGCSEFAGRSAPTGNFNDNNPNGVTK